MYSQPAWAVTVQNPQAHQDRDCPPGGLFAPSLGRWAAQETGLPSASAQILASSESTAIWEISDRLHSYPRSTPHVHRPRSVLIRQLSRGYLRGQISFHLIGALCPESCRSVNTANICCNNGVWGRCSRMKGGSRVGCINPDYILVLIRA